MSSSPAAEAPPPSPAPSTAPPAAPPRQIYTSTPNYTGKKQHSPLNVILPAPNAPATPPAYVPGEPTLTPPPRSPGSTPAGDGRHHPPDGTSSDKSSETAVGGVSHTPSSTAALSRKESYKAQRQHYRREKKRAASALLHSIEDPSVVVLADWLKVRGSLKSWTKLWCVLKPGLLLLYKSSKAKSSHWVGTVLLTSCQVIERPSKKDGFCFKLYHPLEQSIWAPRGPHNETIRAVVQPLPTAHLIFRAPSQPAGHCWLDGLELALRCSNAMLRCSRAERGGGGAAAAVGGGSFSHEELEKHFNEHVLKLSEVSCNSPTPLMSVSDYSPKRHSSSERKGTYVTKKKPRKLSKWAQFIESIEILSKDNTTSDSQSETEKKDHPFLDFIRKREIFDRNTPSTSSMRVLSEPKAKKITSKSLASSPLRVDIKKPILKCFELPNPLRPKEKVSPSNLIEDNLFKLVSSLPKRRSSTPSTIKSLTAKRISELRSSGAKTDSENDDNIKYELPKKRNVLKQSSEILCETPDNIMITKTAPSIERFRRYSSSSTDEVCDSRRNSPFLPHTPDKFSLIHYQQLPSASFAAMLSERRDDRLSSQNIYVAGKVVSELAGAASDSDSEGSRGMADADRAYKGPKGMQAVVARIRNLYTEDPDRETGDAGELVEEVAEENKSLLWFLLKQVRPGMDLSKVVLPTFILEPRSFLDKLSDNYYHADILAQANSMSDPYERFKCVLRWYLSGMYKKPKGLKKPYNPVLGEIFRCCWKNKNDTYTFYVAEQVSHHPPISAFYVSNRKDGYVIEGSLLARSKFYGNSTSAILEGCVHVSLLAHGETYVTTAPYAHCKGIVIGTLSMELGGKVQILCEQTGYHADVEFKLRSFLGSAEQTNAISGRVKKGRDTVATVEGYWDGRIDIKDKRTGDEFPLLEVAQLKEQRLVRYLMKLQHQQDFESQKLWMHVSEAIAKDDQIAATEQKTIVEEGQRERARTQGGNTWQPRYFCKEDAEAPEGIVDQGWRYSHSNKTPWQQDEQFEYEEDFIIKSLRGAGGPPLPAVSGPPLPAAGGTPPPPSAVSSHRISDSDTHEDLARRSKTSTRTLKQSLYAIDLALRDQTKAIERLSKTVESLSEGQRQMATLRPQNMGRVRNTSHSWDMLGGFVLAIVLQALLNWIFYHKD